MIYTDLLDEIKEYCILNEIDLPKTVNKALRDGFTTLKFGLTPMSAKREKKPVEVIKTVEKVIEKIVEVPVDRIVEVIKEVPVDKVIEKNININVDGHNVNYLDYIEELTNNKSKLEIENKKLESTLKGSKEKETQLSKQVSKLNSELVNVKDELKKCIKEKGDKDFYGE